jgi:hypothetical protein
MVCYLHTIRHGRSIDMTVQEYITANSRWLGERISANLAQVPDDKWPAIIAGLDALNAGGSDPGIDCDVVVTRETLEDFERSREQYWAERGTKKEAELAGCRSLLFDHFQRGRGEPRTSCLVIDIGDRRVVLQ